MSEGEKYNKKKFAKELEERTKLFAISIIKLSIKYRASLKEELLNISYQKQEQVQEQITEKQIGREAGQTLKIK